MTGHPAGLSNLIFSANPAAYSSMMRGKCGSAEIDQRTSPRGVRQRSPSRCRSIRVGFPSVLAARAISSSLSRRRGDRSSTSPSTMMAQPPDESIQLPSNVVDGLLMPTAPHAPGPVPWHGPTGSSPTTGSSVNRRAACAAPSPAAGARCPPGYLLQVAGK